MKLENQEVKQQLVQRLHRIEGQLRGVENMLDSGRDCREILQQMAAVQSAMQGASRIFLQEYATACLLDLDEEARRQPEVNLTHEREKIVRDMLALFNKAP